MKRVSLNVIYRLNQQNVGQCYVMRSVSKKKQKVYKKKIDDEILIDIDDNFLDDGTDLVADELVDVDEEYGSNDEMYSEDEGESDGNVEEQNQKFSWIVKPSRSVQKAKAKSIERKEEEKRSQELLQRHPQLSHDVERLTEEQDFYSRIVNNLLDRKEQRNELKSKAMKKLAEEIPERKRFLRPTLDEIRKAAEIGGSYDGLRAEFMRRFGNQDYFGVREVYILIRQYYPKKCSPDGELHKAMIKALLQLYVSQNNAYNQFLYSTDNVKLTARFLRKKRNTAGKIRREIRSKWMNEAFSNLREHRQERNTLSWVQEILLTQFVVPGYLQTQKNALTYEDDDLEIHGMRYDPIKGQLVQIEGKKQAQL